MPFALQRAKRGPRASGARPSRVASLPVGVSALRLTARPARGFPWSRWRQLYTGASRFGKANRDRLLGATRTVLAFADVMHFFADKLPCLGGGRFALASVFVRASYCSLFWHICSLV